MLTASSTCLIMQKTNKIIQIIKAQQIAGLCYLKMNRLFKETHVIFRLFTPFKKAVLLLLLLPTLSFAQEAIRVATWSVELSGKGPGVLLHTIVKGTDAKLLAALEHIKEIDPDILLLTHFDTDIDNHTARAFAASSQYQHFMSSPSNLGLKSGFDLNKNGEKDEPQDAQSYAKYRGHFGMALFSKMPIQHDRIKQFDAFLWHQLPQTQIPDAYFSEYEFENLRLSSSGHWQIPILWNGKTINLLAYAAGSPVFDGAEDRNGARNADETLFWDHLLKGQLEGTSPPTLPIVIGSANLDPHDGDGRHSAINTLLSNIELQDPKPSSDARPFEDNPHHLGDPALDTANWRDPEPGNLRVSYILPSNKLEILNSGIAWHDGKGLKEPFRHGLVWVDIAPLP